MTRLVFLLGRCLQRWAERRLLRQKYRLVAGGDWMRLEVLRDGRWEFGSRWDGPAALESALRKARESVRCELARPGSPW